MDLMSRSLRRAMCRWLAVMLALAQFSIAAYACPRLLPAAVPSAVVQDAMPCADLDADYPNLCAQSCRSAALSADTAATPLPAPAPPVALYRLAWSEPEPPGGQTAPAQAVAPAAASPPLSILHCRRRD
jgi:hypothetical protein